MPYSGIRRLLSSQRTGIERLQSELEPWPVFAKLLSKSIIFMEQIEEAILKQSKERIEAEMAQDDLESIINSTIKTLNMAIQLVNIDHSEVPEDLLLKLNRHQKNHPQVFKPKKENKNPSE